MFESYTYEKLLEEVLNNAPDDIDTRPGSIYYDESLLKSQNTIPILN